MPERLRPIIARARAARDAGDHREAALGYFKAADTARTVELFREMAHCLVYGAEHALHVDKARLALDAAQEALGVYDQTEVPHDMNYAQTARLVALSMVKLDRAGEARAFWSDARAIFDLNGVKEAVAECDAHLSA